MGRTSTRRKYVSLPEPVVDPRITKGAVVRFNKDWVEPGDELGKQLFVVQAVALHDDKVALANNLQTLEAELAAVEFVCTQAEYETLRGCWPLGYPAGAKRPK